MFNGGNEFVDDGLRDVAELVEYVVDFTVQLQRVEVFRDQDCFEVLQRTAFIRTSLGLSYFSDR